MRNPEPPYLQLGFYFGCMSGKEAITHVVNGLRSAFSATPEDLTYVEWTSSSYLRSCQGKELFLPLDNADELDQNLRDSNRFVKRVTFGNGTRIVAGAKEFVAALPIENSACTNETNVVALLVEGEAFSGPNDSVYCEKKSAIARRVIHVFKTLIAQLNPAYAAITCDYGLETPCDLKYDTRTYAFRDFYLSGDEFDEIFLADLRRRFPLSRHDSFERGQITITTTTFRRAIGDAPSDDTGYELSQFVGTAIGTKLG